MIRTILIGAGLICVSVPLAGQAPDEGPEHVVRAFHVALSRGDSSAALALLAPDVVIYESGGVEASRDEYRSHHLAADIQFSAATTREVVTQRSGTDGDLAWVLSQSRTSGTFGDRRIDSRGTETMLLKRTADGWKIVHIHWSSRPVRSDG